MHIVYSFPAVVLCGGVVHHFSVIPHLVRRGHRVTVYTSYVDDLDLLPRLPDSVAVRRHPRVRSNLYSLPIETRPLAFLQTLWDLTLGLRDIAEDFPADADLVHGVFYPNALAADLFRRRTGGHARVLQSIHIDPAYFLPASYRRRYAWMFAHAPLRADGLLAVCEALAATLRARYRKPVWQVGNGIDDALLHEPRAGRDAAVAHIGDHRPYILFVGSIRRRKGIDRLLEALAQLRDSADVQLVLAGKGSWDDVYRPMAVRLGVAEHVRHIPGVDRETLRVLLDGAAAFAFPSRMEGFGIPPLEAMARGVPVICSPCEGVNEYAVDGDNCLYTDSEDVQALAAALLRVLGDTELAQRLGEGGRATAKRFTWEQVADKTEAAMKACLRR